jgi:type IV secretory pathway VirB4 component
MKDITDNFEAWLDNIRVQIYENTKYMSSAEFTDYINAKGRMIAEKYGIRKFENSLDINTVHFKHEPEKNVKNP